MTWTIDLGFERPPLTSNQRHHWTTKAALTKKVRAATSWRARSAKIPALGKCEVTLTWYVTDGRRRDADNLVPTLKAACDGLVDAGIVTDDTPDLMQKHMPIIVRLASGEQKSMTLSIEKIA